MNQSLLLTSKHNLFKIKTKEGQKMSNFEDMFERQDYGKIKETIIEFIRKHVPEDKSVIIGLSGGIDSSLSASLAVDALGAERVIVLTLNNIRYSKEHLAISRRFAEKNNIRMIEMGTDQIREAAIKQTGVDITNIPKISSMDARITDLVIRTLADKEGAIYLGTINGSERITGWYPKGSLFGDYDPIGGLLKSQIKNLAKLQGLPSEIVETISGDSSRICSGCGVLPEFKGIPYDILDVILFWYETEHMLSIIQKLYDHEIPWEMFVTVYNRIIQVKHKQTVFSPFPLINKNANA